MNLQATYRDNLFNTVDELRSHTQKHIDTKDIKGTVKKVLICIEYFCKITKGVCKVKAETLAKKSHTSRSTVMRAIKKLIELNVIKKENHTKLNGIKGASAYIILPFIDTSKTQRDTTKETRHINDSHTIFETEYIKSFNSFNLLNKQINTSNNNLCNEAGT